MSFRLPVRLARLLAPGKKRPPAGNNAPESPQPGTPPLPDNPYRRFYTRQRRLEDLAPRPPETKK